MFNYLLRFSYSEIHCTYLQASIYLHLFLHCSFFSLSDIIVDPRCIIDSASFWRDVSPNIIDFVIENFNSL